MTILSFTEEALAFVQKGLNRDPSAKGLRIGIKQAGCSGFTYDINFAKELPEVDTSELKVLSFGELKVAVEIKSLPYIKQMVVHCVKDDFGEYLKFENPNVKGECGCGESFTVQE